MLLFHFYQAVVFMITDQKSKLFFNRGFTAIKWGWRVSVYFFYIVIYPRE